jgi:DNA-binding NarL/FixJ family response regulator
VGSKIRTVIADDETLIRDYLAVVFRDEADIEVVGLASNGQEALQLVIENDPDVILLDVRMPVMDGLTAAREIRAARPRTKIAMLTASTDRETAFAALEIGADAYLLKDSRKEEIVAALRALVAGEVQVANAALKALIEEFRRLRSTSRGLQEMPMSISAREKEVLRGIVSGLSNKEIAKELGVQVSTVKSHLHNAFEKLGVQDRTQAALLAAREGWFASG